MATVKAIKREKPFDRVAYEPVMLALSKARAAGYLLDATTHPDQTWAPGTDDNLDHHIGWIRDIACDALRAAHDDIEREYRTLGTNLLAKEEAALSKPKDGA
jgi:hypothetical protein